MFSNESPAHPLRSDGAHRIAANSGVQEPNDELLAEEQRTATIWTCEERRTQHDEIAMVPDRAPAVVVDFAGVN